MDTLHMLSLILFGIFLVSYVLKLVFLYRKNSIRANVLAKGHKPAVIKRTEAFVKISTFLWGALWFMMSIADPYISGFTGRHFDLPVIHFIGVWVTSAGCIVFILAMTAMGTSWRVGIDKATPTKLVTRGIYRYSRNAAFTGFDLMFAGLYLMYPNSWTLGILVLNVLAIHLLVLQEEKHLQGLFGEEYREYCRKTPRYLFQK